MSSFGGLGAWQLSVLSVLGTLSVVGMAATLGVRLRSPERPRSGWSWAGRGCRGASRGWVL